MTRYQLAKLVEWAGSLHSRKAFARRSCSFCKPRVARSTRDYTLHHLWPLFARSARLSDEMVQVGLPRRISMPNQVGVQYSYALTKNAASRWRSWKKAAREEVAKPLTPFEAKAKELLNTDLWLLEVASTMVYFRKQGYSWSESVEKTCNFKNLTESAGV